MATKHTDTCLQKAADDEPIFVLRGQDKTAPGVVRFWASKFKDIHFDGIETWDSPSAYPKYKEALDLADAMEHWHGRKLPD